MALDFERYRQAASDAYEAGLAARRERPPTVRQRERFVVTELQTSGDYYGPTASERAARPFEYWSQPLDEWIEEILDATHSIQGALSTANERQQNWFRSEFGTHIMLGLHGQSKHENLEERWESIHRFLDEGLLAGHAKFWVTGIVVRNGPKEIEIEQGLIRIRAMEKEDYEESIYDGRFGFNVEPCAALVELELPVESVLELDERGEQLMLCLQLASNSPIQAAKRENQTIPPESCFRGFQSSSASPRRRTEFLELSDEIQPAFEAFMKDLWPSLRAKLKAHGKKIDPVSIAMTHFRSAIVEFGPPEAKIAKAISGLESLLIQGGQGELSFRLSLLSGIFDEIQGKDGQETFKLIKGAYGIRSKYVHGEALSPTTRKTMEGKYGSLTDMFTQVVDLLRRLICLFIHFSGTKKELLEDLRKAAISPSARNDLKKKITSHVSPP